MKYKLEQEVWFMHLDKIASGKVQARVYKDQISNARSFVFDECDVGATYHLGTVWLREAEMFATKEELVESLLK
jgi:hypothetical protein